VAEPEGEVDETPWVDEEAFAEARAGITPVRPTQLPAGIVMQDVYPLTSEDVDEFGEPCPGLDLVYGPPLDDPEAGELGTDDLGADEWLDVILVTADCARGLDPTPFAPGAYGDVPVREVGGVTEVLVGDTVAQVDTTYRDDVLAALVTSLQPFDLDAEIARLNVEAQEAGLTMTAAEPLVAG
jgi:hypothetical protein